jgi:hypothetical protein
MYRHAKSVPIATDNMIVPGSCGAAYNLPAQHIQLPTPLPSPLIIQRRQEPAHTTASCGRHTYVTLHQQTPTTADICNSIRQLTCCCCDNSVHVALVQCRDNTQVCILIRLLKHCCCNNSVHVALVLCKDNTQICLPIQEPRHNSTEQHRQITTSAKQGMESK